MKQQKGFTLIELMVGMTIGLILLAGVGGLFMTTLRSNVEAVKQQRFEQTVQVLMNIMSSEIRRAGYTNAGTIANPAIPVTLTNQSNNSSYFASTNCVLLSHSTPNEDQRFYGFKLVNSIVYMYSGLVNSPNLCTSTVTDWTAVTDLSYIKVTQLWFDTGKVDLTANYDCVAAPIAGVGAVAKVTLGVEAVGLNAVGTTPVKRCVQVNILKRNT